MWQHTCTQAAWALFHRDSFDNHTVDTTSLWYQVHNEKFPMSTTFRAIPICICFVREVHPPNVFVVHAR